MDICAICVSNFMRFCKNAPSGESNTVFGVYKNSCCGEEIVITKGSTFPACPNHPKSIANWLQIEISSDDVIILDKKSESEFVA